MVIGAAPALSSATMASHDDFELKRSVGLGRWGFIDVQIDHAHA